MTPIGFATGSRTEASKRSSPSRPSVVYPLNRVAYWRRNIIGRMFGRLKNWTRIATRYDRLAINYLSAIVIVATLIQWPG